MASAREFLIIIARAHAFHVEEWHDNYCILAPLTYIKFPPPDLPGLLQAITTRGFGVSVLRVPGKIEVGAPEGGFDAGLQEKTFLGFPEPYVSPVDLPPLQNIYLQRHSGYYSPTVEDDIVNSAMGSTGLKRYEGRKWPVNPLAKPKKARRTKATRVRDIEIRMNTNDKGVGTVSIWQMSQRGYWYKTASAPVSNFYEADKKYDESILAVQRGYISPELARLKPPEDPDKAARKYEKLRAEHEALTKKLDAQAKERIKERMERVKEIIAGLGQESP